MQISRRRLGQYVLCGSAATASLCGFDFAGRSFAAIHVSEYPGLARLACLYRDAAGCHRIASTLSHATVAELTGFRLDRAEQNAERAWEETRATAARVLEGLLADDFRGRRTVEAGGFLLAETEAILALMRGSDSWVPK
jgi:hypothetical protein